MADSLRCGTSSQLAMTENFDEDSSMSGSTSDILPPGRNDRTTSDMPINGVKVSMTIPLLVMVRIRHSVYTSRGGSSSSRMTSCSVPWKASLLWSYDFNVSLDTPPKWFLTIIISTASAIPALFMTFTILVLGIRPVPMSPRGPRSFSCRMSRTVFPVSPAAHAFMGLLNRLPLHQDGYSPVK